MKTKTNKPLTDRIREYRQLQKVQQSKEAAARKHLRRLSFEAGRRWAETEADVETLEGLSEIALQRSQTTDQ